MKVAMLEHDASPVVGLGDEPDLDLAGVVAVGLELPLRADVPGEYDPVGRLVGQDASPAAFAPIDPAVVDVAAGAGFEHRLRDGHGEQVVFVRLDLVELFREDPEGPLDRRPDDDLLANGCIGGLGVSSVLL